jgi:hypothetical protein
MDFCTKGLAFLLALPPGPGPGNASTLSKGPGLCPGGAEGKAETQKSGCLSICQGVAQQQGGLPRML